MMDPVGGKLEPKEKEIKIKEQPIPEEKNPKPEVTTFGASERAELVNNISTPAPNVYQHIDTNPKKKKGKKKKGGDSTFGSKSQKFLLPNYNPGPGAYNHEVAKQESPRFSIGKSQRTSQELPVYTDKFYDTHNLFSKPGIGY